MEESMKEVLLEVEARQLGSKGKLAAMRNSGKSPAVFYGKGIEPQSIAVDSKKFLSIIETKGANVLIALNFKDGSKSAIVKSIQRDIISQLPIHIDFQHVSLTEKIEVSVPIHIEGIADGVKNFGATMETIIREVRISCLPTNIPQTIPINVVPLGIGQGIKIEDLPKLENVDYLQDPSTLILHVVAASAQEEKPAAEGEAKAEPEVISKGKKDKEGEEGAAAGASGDKK
jgi:large subunit ribosomal protein L25